MKVVLITGAREHPALWVVDQTLSATKARIGPFKLRHGAARGVDLRGHRWAKANGCQSHGVKADWDQFGRAAGGLRNSKMVNLGATYCLGFPHPSEPSVGTHDCMAKAHAAGIQTWVVDSEGLILPYSLYNEGRGGVHAVL